MFRDQTDDDDRIRGILYTDDYRTYIQGVSTVGMNGTGGSDRTEFIGKIIDALCGPIITVSPDSLDFGAVAVNDSEDLTLTISNDGNANLTVSDITVDGNYFFTDFDEEFELEPDSSLDLTVTFEPEAAGDFEGTLTITSDDPFYSELTVYICGSGAIPDIAISPDSLDFSDIQVDSSETLDFYIYNQGQADLIVSDIFVVGNYFSVDFGEEFTIEPDDSAGVDVTFTPGDEGELDDDALVVSNDPDQDTVAVYLLGNGLISHPPEVVSPIDDLELDEDFAEYEAADLDTVFTDPDEDELTFTAESDTISLTVNIDADNKLWLNSQSDWNGIAGVTVYADDNVLEPAYQMFMVTVNPLNDDPLWDDVPADQEADEGEEISFTLTADDTDLDFEGDHLTLVMVDDDGTEGAGAGFTDNGDNSGTFSWQTDYEDAGVYDPIFRVEDDSGATADVSVRITVNDVNRPPVLDEIGDREVDEDVELVITLSATDPDEDNLTYSAEDLPEGADLTDNVFSWTPEFGQTGYHYVTFRVTDDGNPNLFDEETITIAVGDINHPPVLDEIGNREVDEDEELAFTLSAADPDDDELTFSAENMPDGASLNGAQFSWTPDYDQAGDYDVTFRVTDNGDPNLSDEETITISVADVNQPPVLSEIGDQDVDENEELMFTLSADDPNVGDNLTYEAFNLPMGAELNDSVFSWTPDFNQDGDWDVTFRVTDDGNPNLYDEEIITITVNNVNRPPVLTYIGDREIDEGQELSILLEADDPDDDSLTFEADNLPAGATLEDLLFTWTPDFDQGGENYQVTFRVTDDGNPNLSDEEAITITVNDVNQPPVLAEIGDQEVDESEALEFTLSADDPDDDNLTYAAQNLPAGASLDDSEFSWTPNYEQSGDHYVTFRVTDDGDPNLTDEETIMITVNNVNRPPALSGIGDMEIDEDEGFSMQLEADDPDSDNLVFEAENLPAGATLENDVFSWTPGYNQSGVYENVIFRVRDDGAPVLSDEETITITVNHVNLMPVLTDIGDLEITEGEDFTLRLEANDYDDDNLTFSADNLPEGASLEDDFFSWTPGYNQAGDWDVTFRVTDDGEPNLYDEETVTITVLNENRPPVLAHIGDDETGEGEELVITLSADDPDGDALTYSVINMPQGAELTGAEFNWTPGYDQAGSYDITFRVTDNGSPNLYDEETITITVNDVNRPPVLANIGDQEIDENEQITLELEADDPDNNNLVFSAINMPQGADFNDDLFSWTPDYNHAGDWELTFRVTDDGDPNLFDEETVTITVNDINRPPVLTAIGNREIDENAALAFTLSADDPDDDGLTFTMENSPAGAHLDGANFSWTPDYDQDGNYDVTFRVTDNGAPNLSDEETITITVNDINRPPVLSEIGSLAIDETEDFILQLEADDPDGDNLSFVAENLPEGAELTNNIFSWTPTYEQAGNYENVLFRATDNGAPNLSDEETISITVNDINRAPVWDYIPQSASVNENQLLEFTVRASDPDGDDMTIVYSSDDLPEEADFSDNGDGTGLFSWRPAADEGGAYLAVFTLSDGSVDVPEEVIITVGDINRPPIWDDVTRNREIDETEELQFTVTGSDPDGDDVTILYSSENIPEAAEFSDNGEGVGTFTWTPTYDDAGNYTATFTISDEEYDISVEVRITVNNVNRAPALTDIGNLELNEDEEFTLQLEASDPDDNILSFEAENLPEGANLAGNTFSWTPTCEQAGVYENVTFRVVDNGRPQASDEETITITVLNVNRSPVLAEIGSQEVDENDVLEFTLSAEDPDGNELTYSAENLPEGAELDSTQFSWTPDFEQAGNYEVTFRVTDNGDPNLSDDETITITVSNVNRPPVLADIGNLEINEGEEFTLQLEASDPDVGDNLTYEAENLPEGATLQDDVFSWTPGNDQAGAYEDVVFHVTDDGDPNLSDEETITITVGNVNRPPQFAEIEDQEVDEGSAGLEFTLSADDPDGDEMTFSYANMPAGAELTGAEFSWTPDYDQAGEYQVTFIVTDNGAPRLSDETAVTITVHNVNRAPVLSDIGNLEIDEGEEFSLRLEANDPDGDNLTFAAENLPEGASLEDNLFSWTPDFNQASVYENVIFRVTDDGDPQAADEETITITVLNVNRPPVLSEIGNRETDEGSELEIILLAEDPDDDELTYSAQNLPEGAALEDAVFNWSPGYDQAGDYEVTFRVTDNGDPNLFDEETIVISVDNVNRAPVLAEIGSLHVDADEELVITLSAEDPDGDDMTYSAENLPEGAQLDCEQFSWTPDFDQAGNHQVTFRVTDDGEPPAFDEETITITVGDVNRPPVLAGIDDREVDEGVELEITLSAEDPDGDDLTFTAINLPEGAELEGAVFSWTPAFDQAGQYEVTFRVTDNGDPQLFDEQTITITVNNVNHPPVLTDIGNLETEEGEELAFELEAEDPDGDTLSFEADNLPENAQLDGSRFSWTPGFDQAGDYEVTFRVVDNGDPQLSDEETLTITVINLNRAPVLTEIGDREVNEDEALVIALTAEDPDGDEMTFAVENIPEGAELDSSTFSWRPGFDQAGEYRVVFVVTDDGESELSDRESIIISVINVNHPPELDRSIDDVAFDEDPDPRRFNIADLDTVFSDPDGDELTFSINQDDLPRQLNIRIEEDSNILLIEPEDNFNLADGVEITIIASDEGQDAMMLSQDGSTWNASDYLNIGGPVRSLRTAVQQKVKSEILNPKYESRITNQKIMNQRADSPRRDDTVDETFMLTVNPVNDPPEWVDVPGDQEAHEEELVRFTLTAWDVDLDFEGDELHLSMIDDDGTTDRGAEFVDNGDNSGTFTWQTDAEDTGEYDPVFQVLDEAGAAVDVSVHIFIGEFNNPPTVVNHIGDVEIDEDPDPRRVEIADLDSVFSDPDGDSLDYEFAGAQDEINMNINQENVIFFEPDQDYNLPDGALITVTATDQEGATATDTFRVVIIPVNDSPAAFSLLSPVNGSVVELAVNEVVFRWEEAEDVDNDDVTYNLNLQVTWEEFDTTVTQSDLVGTEFMVEDIHELLIELGYVPGEENRIEAVWWVEANDGELLTESNERWTLIIEVPTSIGTERNELPTEFSMSQNYPNPFNPSTHIDIALPHTSQVKLSVWNASGRLLEVLASGQLSAGRHSITWTTYNLPTGAYIFTLEAEDVKLVTRGMLIR